jgi:hypothetical protein
MAVEKAALDLTDCSMAECRTRLDNAVGELEKVVKSTSKATVRRRIRKATERVRFDQIIVVEPSKR